MRHVVLAIAALLALMPTAASAQSTTATDLVSEAISGLSANPVYVHPEAQSLLSSTQAEALRTRIRNGGLGPVYIAVLPATALNAGGGDPVELLRLIGEGVGRRGTYAVVAGRTFRAGATAGTPFSQGTVPAVADAAAQSANGDVATLLNNFIGGLEQAQANGGRQDRTGSSGGFGLLPLLVLGGLAFFAFRGFSRRKRDRAHLEEVRRVAQEDLTSLGNDIYDLESAFTMPGSHPEARAYYDGAINAYQRARSAMERARRPDDLAAATEAMEEGRFAVASVRALLAGQPVPEHRPPCFFAPSHGPSTREVQWAPPGGDPRPVPACEADAQRVERGDEPMTREVIVNGQRRPYWDAPPWYGGWAGGYYGGFGGLGFLQGALWGSLLGGGWGIGMPHGGYHDAGGGFGGFGGGDFGGGFGGGDFGGGGFGGGDF